MSLSAGARVGPYEVISLLGAGAMGEVYRARDARLGRDVALKLLPAAFTADPERLARFEREARVLASLNHPNIGAIYGFEDSGHARALVLELIEGQTLADHLSGRALPAAKALVLAGQIAAALDAAHQRGVVHRDLKPENISITTAGAIKVLDFGLAKSIGGLEAEAARSEAATMTVASGATEPGTILGTAAYMSPEQARGHEVDKRADIWAFGCVLYEMLTSRRAFAGATLTDTLVAIVEKAPDWTLLPSGTPAGIRRLLERCLEKDPTRRLRDIGDARWELEGASESAASSTGAPRPRRGRTYLVFAALAIALIATGAALSRLVSVAGGPDGVVSRTTIVLPPGTRLSSQSRMAISPDGSTLAYVAVRGLQSELYVRPLDALEPKRVPSGDGALHPFFSPDGQWLAFFADGALQRVSLNGGAPLRICNVTDASAGGTWGANDTIVFAVRGRGLFTVSAGGGVPEPIAAAPGARWPEFLADGRRVLYSVLTDDTYALAVISADGTGQRTVATLSDSREDGVPVLGAGGGLAQAQLWGKYILYGQSPGLVRALPVDPESLEPTGPSISLVDSAERGANAGPVAFAAARTGLLVYATTGERHQLVWVDRNGVVTPISQDREAFREPVVSRDGRRIAVAVNDSGTRQSSIWLYDAERGTKTRLTSDRHSLQPVWSPDGRHIVVGSGDLVEFPVDGGGAGTVLASGDALRDLLRAGTAPYPTSWSPDGQRLLFQADNQDIWVLERGSSAPTPLMSRPADDWAGQFSPDGHSILYVSRETGQPEVYVASLPDLSARTVVSTGGGHDPRWSRTGHEVYFRQGDAMMVAVIERDAGFRVTPPRVLFSGAFSGTGRDSQFDVAPDGQRFVMVKSDERAELRELTVVQNLFHDLEVAP